MINAATAVTDAASGAAAMKKATGMNKDDFLKLFIAQMQNQDPLNPMDGTQFIGQLAQLTQVEQAYNTNSNLQSLISAQNGSNNLGAVSFLGTTILAHGDQINLTTGGAPTVAYNLSTAAEGVVVEIRDASGALVRTLSRGAAPQGDNSIGWDGKGENGQSLTAGMYTVGVTATDSTGKQFAATPLVQGKVDGIALDGTTPLLSVGGINIPLSDVLTVKGV